MLVGGYFERGAGGGRPIKGAGGGGLSDNGIMLGIEIKE